MLERLNYILTALGVITVFLFLFFKPYKPKSPMKKLIAFGDSLTAGYQTGIETPYTDYMKPLLGNEWVLENMGINGELTSQMLERFERDVIRHKPDVVVILGGTNDIGWGIETQTIIKNLKTMIQQALDAGITPIPCAIPSLIGFNKLIQPRQEVNTAIAQFAKERKIHFVDLFSATTDEKNWLDQKYSSDGLHLNTQGYKLMAQTIYQQALTRIVNRSDPEGAENP
jgi:lysophospholipase L1-like esterase